MADKTPADEIKERTEVKAKPKPSPKEAAAKSSINRSTDPEEEKIESKRLSLKIPSPDDYKTAASRQALGRLNMKNETADDTAEDTAKRLASENKAKPFAFKKGGRVKKGGLALVHTGEKVMTKSQAKSASGRKMISCKR
jgi:hypothetical protein